MEPEHLLGKQFFVSNRQKLRKAFGGKAPIVIAGNGLMQKSADASFPFVQDSNFWYLTGIREPGLILVMEVDREYVITPAHDVVRETFEGKLDFSAMADQAGIEEAFSEDDGWKILSRRAKKVKHIATIQPSPSYIEQITMYTSPARARLVTRLKVYNPDINLIDLRPVFASMRSVKTAEELKLIKAAAKETAHLYKLIERKRSKVEFENELLAELQREITRRGVEFAYDPIIASGKNALTLHYTNNDAPIGRSKFLLLDVAVRAHGYNADITRTVVDNPTKRQTQVYNAVLAVQEFAISLLKPGTNLKTYEEAVFQFMGEKLRELGLIQTISKESVRKFYPHATSHFLGIDVHDVGDHGSELVTGMVLTVEPGIYIQKESIGIRIEDMVVITEKGCEILSKSIPKTISKLA